MKKILIKNDLPKIEKLYTFGRTSKLTSKIVLRIFDIHRYQNYLGVLERFNTWSKVI